MEPSLNVPYCSTYSSLKVDGFTAECQWLWALIQDLLYKVTLNIMMIFATVTENRNEESNANPSALIVNVSGSAPSL